MRKLTEQTGGRVINVGNKFDKLREAFDQIAAELRSQYNIGYTPDQHRNSTAPTANSKSRTSRTTKSSPAPDTTPGGRRINGKRAFPPALFPKSPSAFLFGFLHAVDLP